MKYTYEDIINLYKDDNIIYDEINLKWVHYNDKLTISDNIMLIYISTNLINLYIFCKNIKNIKYIN